MKKLGIVLMIIGLIGILYFGNAIDSVKASLQMYPMSVEPPSEKISPLLKEKMKEMKEVPVVVELTAPTDMAIAQQQLVISQLSMIGFKPTLQIFGVGNEIAGTIPSNKVEELASNPYVKRVLYDGFFFKAFGNYSTPREAMAQALRQIHALGLPYTGKGVTVIVIDSGIDSHHPWIRGHVVEVYKTCPCPAGRNWTMPHGTHVAGIILAVAPDVKLVNIVALGSNGEARLSWILKALDIAYHLADKYKPCLCSCSWGAYPENTPEMDAVRDAVARLEKVMPVVFAAGNFGAPKTIACPADVDDVITVGAVDSTNHIAWFSSRGPDTYGKEHMEPDVVAPGVGIVSAKAGGGVIAMSGTSMACPFVSGVVALMLQKNPNLTNEDCLKILEKTAKDLGPKGFDYTYGYGLVQADKALGIVTQEPIVVKTSSGSIGEGLSILLLLIGGILFVRGVEHGS